MTSISCETGLAPWHFAFRFAVQECDSSKLPGLEEPLLHRFLIQVEHNNYADDNLKAFAGDSQYSRIHHSTGNGRDDKSDPGYRKQHSGTTCPVPSLCETCGKSQQQHGVQNECDGAELLKTSTN